MDRYEVSLQTVASCHRPSRLSPRGRRRRATTAPSNLLPVAVLSLFGLLLPRASAAPLPPDAESLTRYDLAIECVKKKDYDCALQNAEAASALNSHEGLLYFRARLHQVRGEHELAFSRYVDFIRAFVRIFYSLHRSGKLDGDQYADLKEKQTNFPLDIPLRWNKAQLADIEQRLAAANAQIPEVERQGAPGLTQWDSCIHLEASENGSRTFAPLIPAQLSLCAESSYHAVSTFWQVDDQDVSIGVNESKFTIHITGKPLTQQRFLLRYRLLSQKEASELQETPDKKVDIPFLKVPVAYDLFALEYHAAVTLPTERFKHQVLQYYVALQDEQKHDLLTWGSKDSPVSLLLERRVPRGPYRLGVAGRLGIAVSAGGVAALITSATMQGAARWYAGQAIADSECRAEDHQIPIAGTTQCPHYGTYSGDPAMNRAFDPSTAEYASRAETLQIAARDTLIAGSVLAVAGAGLILVDRFFLFPNRQESLPPHVLRTSQNGKTAASLLDRWLIVPVLQYGQYGQYGLLSTLQF